MTHLRAINQKKLGMPLKVHMLITKVKKIKSHQG